MMGSLSRNIDESSKVKAEEGVKKTAETRLSRDLGQMAPEGQGEQERQLYASERYIEPPVEQASQNLEADLNALQNPEMENKEFVPQLLNLFETARTKTGKAARQASATLSAGIDLLKKTKEIKLTAPWQKQIDSFVSVAGQQNKDPENKELAEQARMRAGVIAENHSMYRDLQNKTNIPKERIDAFMDLRAATEARIMDEGVAAGLSMDEIEKQQKDAREQELKVFLTKAKKDGYEISPELLDKLNIFIDIADHRSELHDKGAYIEASNAETYTEYTTVMENAGLNFLITEQSITMDMLEEDGDAVEVSPEAFLWERDILDLWLDEQQQEEDIENMLEELKEWEENARENSGDNLFAADLPKSLREAIEKELGEELSTGTPINDVKNKLQQDPEVYTAMLKTAPLEVPPGAGNWVGPFFSDPLEVIKDNGAEGVRITPQVMKARVSANFIDTAAEATRGEVIFSPPEEGEAQTPESAVTAYLEDPENGEKKKVAFEALRDPDNRRLRAAYLEALARTANELRLERST
ncbi:hypothetical protein GF415_03625 [Candidatus Micrarchaeota archaeon]|nr:hypothetical protein [Candidatus Micrarchaeota archaeon]